MIKPSKNKILGKKCILYFYPNDFNPGCTIEAEEFSKFFEEFKTNKIEIVGISDDDPDSHQEFCESIKIPYTLLSDTEHIVSELFGVTEMKNFLGILTAKLASKKIVQIFGTFGLITGIISDVLQPLAPFTSYLFFVSAIFFVLLLFLHQFVSHLYH